jgi:membrane fusion protein (multidrug efflux system)
MSFDEPGDRGSDSDEARSEGGSAQAGDAQGSEKRDDKGGDKGAEKNGGKAADKDGDQGKDGKGKDGDDEQSKKPRSKTPLIIVGVIVIVAAIVAFIVWFADRNQVSTDDAYTDGNVITMVPKVAGYVVGLYVDDNSLVKKGDLLLRIDQRDYRTVQAADQAALDLAQAQLKSARDALRIARIQYPAQLLSAEAQQRSAAAALADANASYARQHEVDRRATTQESIDQSTSQQQNALSSLQSAKAQVAIARLIPEQVSQAEATVAQRKAQVEQAQAQLDQANLNLGYTEIRAPSDGFITMRSAQLGGYLAAGQTMFMIVTPEVWVTANFKESQLGRMRLGDAVDIEIDAYSAVKLQGHVQSIQYGTGARFSAFPAENATGNFVKIVQRVPVKIVIDKGLDPDRPLPLGLSAEPVVHFP